MIPTRDTVLGVWTFTLVLLTCLGIDFSNPLLPGVVRFGEADSFHALRTERTRTDERPSRTLPSPPEPVQVADVRAAGARPAGARLERPASEPSPGRPRASLETVRSAPTAPEDH